MTFFEVDEFLIVLSDLFDVASSLGRFLWFDKFQTLFRSSNEVSTWEIESSGQTCSQTMSD